MGKSRARSGPSRRSAGGDADIAAIGILVADQARCRILFALADGRSLPASRLATEAEVTAATASSHLRKLTAAGLLSVEINGRFRNYRLAGSDVANLIEALERLAPTMPVRSLGVEVMAVLVDRGDLKPTEQSLGSGHVATRFKISEEGTRFLNQFGVPLSPSRQPVRHHLDSTEPSPHLSGALGRALLTRFCELQWIERSPGSRSLRVTQSGQHGLKQQFGISPSTGSHDE
jgi:DNA-binding transcriptional ArsR family regulator